MNRFWVQFFVFSQDFSYCQDCVIENYRAIFTEVNSWNTVTESPVPLLTIALIKILQLSQSDIGIRCISLFRQILSLPEGASRIYNALSDYKMALL